MLAEEKQRVTGARHTLSESSSDHQELIAKLHPSCMVFGKSLY